MQLDSERFTDAVERETVRSASKLLLGATAVLFVFALVTALPGVDRLVPETPVDVAAVLAALATVVLVALLVSLAPKFASLTRMVLEEPREVVEHLAAVVYWLIVLVAVIVAHAGLSGVATAVVDATWLYDLLFLLAALPPLTVIAARLWVALDPGADLVADALTGGDDETSASGTAGTARGRAGSDDG